MSPTTTDARSEPPDIETPRAVADVGPVVAHWWLEEEQFGLVVEEVRASARDRQDHHDKPSNWSYLELC